MPLPRPLLTVLLAAAVLPVTSAVAATPAADADLHCGRLFDARSGKLLGPHTVQVQAGRIVAVSPGLPSTTGSGAIDQLPSAFGSIVFLPRIWRTITSRLRSGASSTTVVFVPGKLPPPPAR